MRRWPVPSILVITLLLASAAHAQWTWTPETGRFVNMNNLPKETPELQVEYTRSLMVGGELSKAFAETEKFQKFYPNTDYSDDNQFLRGEIQLADEKYQKAAEEFQVVISNYPDSPLYDDVIDMQYEIGDGLFEKGRLRLEKREGGWRPWTPLRKLNPFKHKPLKKAIDVYTMVIDNQPFTSEAAEAQYKVGRCHFIREEYMEASFEYRRVIEDYPDSDWVREASFGLTRCYEEAALSPNYDQAPSRLALESIDEFSRRYPADPRVRDRKKIRGEMRETIAKQRLQTAKFYEKRRDIFSARIYYEIVASDFRETQAAQAAQEWLDRNPPLQRAQVAFVGPATLN